MIINYLCSEFWLHFNAISPLRGLLAFSIRVKCKSGSVPCADFGYRHVVISFYGCVQCQQLCNFSV
jgi:hypothetical protein